MGHVAGNSKKINRGGCHGFKISLICIKCVFGMTMKISFLWKKQTLILKLWKRLSKT